MKVRVKALKRGTAVSPSTGQQVHFDPGAKRFPLAKRPFVDERDVDFFVEKGFAERPREGARTYGAEEERRVIAEEGRRPQGAVDGARASKRVAAAAGADAAGGSTTSGLDTRQVRHMDPASGVDQNVGKGAGEGDEAEGGEAEGGLEANDRAAPPAGGAAAARPASRPRNAREPATKTGEGKKGS